MNQIKASSIENAGPENQTSLLHDLRDKLNTIQSSAMVLDRVGAVGQDHQKYLDWILEKVREADDLIDLIGKSQFDLDS